MSKIYSNFASKIPSAEFTDIELALRRISIQTKTTNFHQRLDIRLNCSFSLRRESRVAVVSLGVIGRYLFGDFCDRALALFEKHQNEIYGKVRNLFFQTTSYL